MILNLFARSAESENVNVNKLIYLFWAKFEPSSLIPGYN